MSTIRTWDGAEVIVPNAMLTSERVTNWRLSDTLRRVTLDVGVAYSADPRHVLDILLSVATAHPKAVSDPPPVAVCMGFGDSALKFQLRAWTRVDDAESFRSELAIAVHGALSAAKIEIPFPQRDIHIRNGEGDRVGDILRSGLPMSPEADQPGDGGEARTRPLRPARAPTERGAVIEVQTSNVARRQE